MPRYNCFYAISVPAYADFSIEAESEEAAEVKLQQMLEHGCFDDVTVAEQWECVDLQESRRFTILGQVPATAERFLPDASELDGFVPLSECTCENLPVRCGACLAKLQDESHASDCASRCHTASECTCGLADRLAAQEKEAL